MIFPDFKIENNLIRKGYKSILAIDEAGRGPLAGPLICAGILYEGEKNIFKSNLIRDSKLLSEKQRSMAYNLLIHSNIKYCYTIISSGYIDKYGLSKSLTKSFQKIIKKLQSDVTIIDGNTTFGIKETPTSIAIIKGDQLSKSIAAASIIAKVTRDNFMKNINKKFSNYSFSQHKGYGTKKHINELKKYGVSSIHRSTFLKNINHQNSGK